MIVNQDILDKTRYLTYAYRWNILSNPADESIASRQLWSIIANNRIYAIKYIKNFKLTSNKDVMNSYLSKMFEDVLSEAIKEYHKLDRSFTEQEFLDGYLGKSWNSNKKHATIFDVMTESVERWHLYFLGVGLVFDKEAWISLTCEKLKWPKRRFGLKTTQPFVRSLEMRRHFPYAEKQDIDNLFFDDCGVTMFNDSLMSSQVRKVYYAKDNFC